MRITMTEAEIKASIVASIEAQGFNLAGKTIDIDLKATRGDAGYTAEIDINNAGETSETVPAKTKSLEIESKVTRAKSEPVEEPANDADQEAADAEEAEQAETAEDEEAPEPSARKSLFGDAKRPVNA